jgi:hypothetical protein
MLLLHNMLELSISKGFSGILWANLVSNKLKLSIFID